MCKVKSTAKATLPIDSETQHRKCDKITNPENEELPTFRNWKMTQNQNKEEITIPPNEQTAKIK